MSARTADERDIEVKLEGVLAHLSNDKSPANWNSDDGERFVEAFRCWLHARHPALYERANAAIDVEGEYDPIRGVVDDLQMIDEDKASDEAYLDVVMALLDYVQMRKTPLPASAVELSALTTEFTAWLGKRKHAYDAATVSLAIERCCQ